MTEHIIISGCVILGLILIVVYRYRIHRCGKPGEQKTVLDSYKDEIKKAIKAKKILESLLAGLPNGSDDYGIISRDIEQAEDYINTIIANAKENHNA